nr:hypothetical protein Iba_chr07aCG4990 [Ipomoea batatas]
MTGRMEVSTSLDTKLWTHAYILQYCHRNLILSLMKNFPLNPQKMGNLNLRLMLQSQRKNPLLLRL